MAFTIPDKGEGISDNMSVLWQEHIRALVQGISSYTGILNGFYVSASGGMGISWGSGTVRYQGKNILIAQGSTTLTADATHPRWASVYAMPSGAVAQHYLETAATPPKITTWSDSIVPVAFIYVPAGATALTAANIVDARVFINPAIEVAGLKNLVINGGFRINQRGYVSGAATSAGQYTLDRWKVTGTNGISWSTTANKTTVTIPAGQEFQQVIEGLNLQSGNVTLSWEGTAQGKIGAGSYSASGISGSATGGTNLTISFNAGTVANVQLEYGWVPTLFEQRPIGAELALCQRYYYHIGGYLGAGLTANRTAVGIGYSATTTTTTIATSFPVKLRTNPTVTLSGSNTLSGYGYAGTATVVSSISGEENSNSFLLSVDHAATTAGNPRAWTIRTDLDEDAFLSFSAEL